jgi:hypothetical protein
MKRIQLTPRHYAWFTSALFLIQVAIEGAHAAIGNPWLGFGTSASLAMSALWCVVWLVAAVGVLLHRGWGGAFAAIGAVASLMHGLVILSAGNAFGLLYIAFGVALIVCVKRASTWFGWDTFPEPAVHA